MEVLAQADSALAKGVCLEADGMGEGTYTGCKETVFGDKRHLFNFGMGVQEMRLAIPQERLRGRQMGAQVS